MNFQRHVEWRLAEQHLRGTPEEVAAQLDDLIVALVACRRTLGVDRTPEARIASERPRIWGRKVK